MTVYYTILVAALRLFAVHGYEAVSVSQIAGALGITKGIIRVFSKNGIPKKDYSEMPGKR